MTILGRHTISETRDLLSQMEWRIDKLNEVLSGYKRTEPEVLNKDETLVRDWDNFLKRWVDAKGWTKASYIAALAANPLVGPDIIPDEDNYQALLHAGSTTYPGYTDTDLPGLQERIRLLHPERKLDFGPMPKNYSLDLDLQMYHAADNAAKGVEAAYDKSKETANDFLANNYGKILFVGAAGVGAYIVGKKLHLL